MEYLKFVLLSEVPITSGYAAPCAMVPRLGPSAGAPAHPAHPGNETQKTGPNYSGRGWADQTVPKVSRRYRGYESGELRLKCNTDHDSNIIDVDSGPAGSTVAFSSARSLSVALNPNPLPYFLPDQYPLIA